MNTPEIVFLEIENMTRKGKTKFILNACNVSYTPEWKLVFDSLSHFVYQMVKAYQACNDSA